MTERTQASAFLRVLFGAYGDGWIEARAIKDGAVTRHTYRLPYALREDHWRMVDELIGLSDRGWDVYVGVLPRIAPPGPGHPGGRKAIEQIGIAWIDLDRKVDGAELSMLDDCDMVVSTGNGWHGYKTVSPPTRVASDRDRKQVEQRLRSWCLSVCPGVDNVSDLPRILRLPGTRNHKDKANPKPVELLRCPIEIPEDAPRINRWHPWFTFPMLADLLVAAEAGTLGIAKPRLELPSGRWANNLDWFVTTAHHGCMVARRDPQWMQLVVQAWMDLPYILAHVYGRDAQECLFDLEVEEVTK